MLLDKGIVWKRTAPMATILAVFMKLLIQVVIVLVGVVVVGTA